MEKVRIIIDNFTDMETKEVIAKGKIWEASSSRCEKAVKNGWAEYLTKEDIKEDIAEPVAEVESEIKEDKPKKSKK